MSIQSEITRINNNISSAYSAIDAKGGTLPQTQNSANLASSIQSISGGGSSLPEDPSTDGAYKLVNTVETDSETQEQSATLSWEEDKEYTAGAGIFIENNVINNKSVYSNMLMNLLIANLDHSSYGLTDTIDWLINGLLGGTAYLINSSGSNRTASSTLMNKLDCYSIITFNSNGTYSTEIRISSYTFERTYIYFKQGSYLVRIANNDQYAFLNNIAYQNTTSGLTATTVKGAIDEVAQKTAAATTTSLGTVQPDGTTITVENGVISAVGGGGGTEYTFTNGLTESDGTVSWDLNNVVKSGSGNNSLVVGYSGNASGIRSVCLGGVNGIAGGQYSVSIGGAQIANKEYAIGIGFRANANSRGQVVIGASNYNTDAHGIFGLVFGTSSGNNNYGTTTTVDINGHHYIKGDIYVGCTDYTTTSSGPTTANCGGQKVFYGSMVSTETTPSVEGAINWLYE